MSGTTLLYQLIPPSRNMMNPAWLEEDRLRPGSGDIPKRP